MTAQELLEQFRNLRLSDAEGLSSNLEALSSNPSVLSRDLVALSRDPRSLDKVDAARKAWVRRALFVDLSGGFGAQVGVLGRRTPPDEVQPAVLDVLRLLELPQKVETQRSIDEQLREAGE